MTNWNSENNRVVWVDIPVVDLDRAAAFYGAVLGVKVHHEEHEGARFCVFERADGNSGCLVPKEGEVSASTGITVYFNVDKRIRAAVREVEAHGGIVDKDVMSIGQHGYCAIVVDSEGNRIALHSTVDA